MRWMFAGGNVAIVTGAAASNYLGMIDYHHGLPYRCRVAVFTDVCRQGMRRAFAGRVRAVMTVYAATRDGRMIEGCWQPGSRGVAVVADVAAGNMRRVLAGCNDAVMATVAGPDYLGVIDAHYRREDIRVMAVFTDICRLNVSTVFTDRLGAVMTANTGTGDIQVIEIRG